MLAQSIRVAARSAAPVLRRRFGTSLPRRDLITDLYIKELKAYQAPPVKASDSVGQVKPWSAPSAPAIPAVEAAAEADLAEYDSQAVEVEGIAETTESEAPTESLDDWFVVEAIEDAHH
ncbi:ATP synthase complex subunit H-domain-containing protein [Kockiozyma suomiensis]|uniref:ATP synthase complex subunit H-domain-containing protein n=1 Tax=Kockiozyma suomiensis TaxID=1337062 RepID=UPI0033435A5F